jgi:tRNA/rRNA methyltransferase
MSIDPDALRVVLVSPRNPLNIGAAARAMSNFGFLCMRVVNAYDVAYAEAKSAVNASAVLERSEQAASVAAAVADCTLVVGTASPGHRLLQHPFRRLEYGAWNMGPVRSGRK